MDSMDRTTATNFTVLFMFLNLLFWTFVWEPVANTLHLSTLCQLALFQVILFLLPTALYLYFTKSSPKQILRLNRLSLKNIILIICIAITIQPAMSLLSLLSSFLFKPELFRYCHLLTATPCTCAVSVAWDAPTKAELVLYLNT